MKKKLLFISSTLLLNIFISNTCFAQDDTVRVMVENLMKYGVSNCPFTSGTNNSYLHSQLKILVKYTNPDILGLVKMNQIDPSPSNLGASPYGFADSIITYALDPNYPGRYAYCNLTYYSPSASTTDILFYNQNKFGSVSVTNLCTIDEDFNLYKLYYKDPNLSITHDSTFLYVILNHTISGSSSTGRDQQDSTIVTSLKKIFYHYPNLIDMGDLNTRTSTEPGYELLTSAADTNYMFYDPPFTPDNKFTYPLNWENSGAAQPYYNTSTVQNAPNGSGTCYATGGGKDWYMHILLSPWIVNNFDYIKYIPKSYTTIGNDGKRQGISINDSTTNGKNTSAPANVLDAIYNLTDKYPVMVSLGITYNTTGHGPANPVNHITGINEINPVQNLIRTNNPINNNITLNFSSNLIGQNAVMSWFDLAGRLIATDAFSVFSNEINRATNLSPGMYVLRIQVETYNFFSRIVEQ